MFTARDAIKLADLAGIQYVGHAGDSMLCVQAVRRLVQYAERPSRALLLTAERHHAYLFSFEREGHVAVKNGFTSGYRGTGPAALAESLHLLASAHIDVEEVLISMLAMGRLEASALTSADIRDIELADQVRPLRTFDYVHAAYGNDRSMPSVWRNFEPIMPWAIVDQRLVEQALQFRAAPDKAIMDGFRKLEDLVRERTGLSEHGAKLFSQAFAGEESLLVWHRRDASSASAQGLIDKGEQAGRAQMFTGAYQAFRNPRAHSTPGYCGAESLAEFLMLNQLFLLERTAEDREPSVSQ